MSIAAVVTRGYSNGTFTGSIAEVVTRGYTIAAAAAPAPAPSQAGGGPGRVRSWMTEGPQRKKKPRQAPARPRRAPEPMPRTGISTLEHLRAPRRPESPTSMGELVELRGPIAPEQPLEPPPRLDLPGATILPFPIPLPSRDGFEGEATTVEQLLAEIERLNALVDKQTDLIVRLQAMVGDDAATDQELVLFLTSLLLLEE